MVETTRATRAMKQRIRPRTADDLVVGYGTYRLADGRLQTVPVTLTAQQLARPGEYHEAIIWWNAASERMPLNVSEPTK